MNTEGYERAVQIRLRVYAYLIAVGVVMLSYNLGFIDAVDHFVADTIKVVLALTDTGKVALDKPSEVVIEHKRVTPIEQQPTITATVESSKQHDWLEITDKAVDWIVKIIGAVTALVGVMGFHRTKAKRVRVTTNPNSDANLK